MGMTSIRERHEENPMLHEPEESPNLGFSMQVSAQRHDNMECGHHWTPLGRDECLQGVDCTVLFPGNCLGCVAT